MNYDVGFKIAYWTMFTICIVLIATVAFFAFTDAWPWAHEAIWQRSFRPVCEQPNHALTFCKP